MKIALIVVPVLLLTGCNSAPTLERSLEKGRQIQAGVQASTLASGWRVDCVNDQHLAARTCFASKFNPQSLPFRVSFINGVGPRINAGHNTYPGRTATVRIDSGPVRQTSDAGKIVQEMRHGKTAYVVYHSWPDGPNRMELDASGFDEAYQKLLAIK